MTAADHAKTARTARQAIRGVFEMYGVNLTPVNMLDAALDALQAQADQRDELDRDRARVIQDLFRTRERAKAAEAERDRLADALREIERAAKIGITQKNRLPDVVGILATARGALAQTEQTPQRHGRGCGCTPCQTEDWDAIDAGLAQTEQTP